MNPYQQIVMLLREEKVAAAEGLAALVQRDLAELVLLDGSYSLSVVLQVARGLPLVAIASVLCSAPSAEPPGVIAPKSVCANLLHRNAVCPGISESWDSKLRRGFEAEQSGLGEQDAIAFFLYGAFSFFAISNGSRCE
jgi:hypothetical protein